MSGLGMLLNLHDGDDRCGCLRHVIDLFREGIALGVGADDLDGAAETALLDCLEQHPAGSLYRSLERPLNRALDRSLNQSHGRTDGRTNEDGGHLA